MRSTPIGKLLSAYENTWWLVNTNPICGATEGKQSFPGLYPRGIVTMGRDQIRCQILFVQLEHRQWSSIIQGTSLPNFLTMLTDGNMNQELSWGTGGSRARFTPSFATSSCVHLGSSPALRVSTLKWVNQYFPRKRCCETQSKCTATLGTCLVPMINMIITRHSDSTTQLSSFRENKTKQNTPTRFSTSTYIKSEQLQPPVLWYFGGHVIWSDLGCHHVGAALFLGTGLPSGQLWVKVPSAVCRFTGPRLWRWGHLRAWAIECWSLAWVLGLSTAVTYQQHNTIGMCIHQMLIDLSC